MNSYNRIRQQRRGILGLVSALALSQIVSFNAHADHDIIRGSEHFTRQINQYYSGLTTINLESLLRTGSLFAHRQIETIVLNASSDLGRGQATLLLNGRQIAQTEIVDRFETSHSFRLARGTLSQLNLRLNGRILLNSISVVFADQNTLPSRNIIQARVGRYFYGRSILGVRQILNLDQRYNGRRIQGVILQASSEAGYGTAQLLINGVRVGLDKQLNRLSQRRVLQLPVGTNVLGRDIQSIQLELDGNIRVDVVGVILDERRLF